MKKSRGEEKVYKPQIYKSGEESKDKVSLQEKLNRSQVDTKDSRCSL